MFHWSDIGHPSRADGWTSCGAIGQDTSEYIAPGRADGKGGIDETDVRVGLREISALNIRCGDEMLGEQSGMIGREEHPIEDRPGLRDPSQPGERLSDPKGADDESSFRFSEVVVSHVAVKKPAVLAAMPKRQFASDVQHRGLAELPVWVAQDRELGKGGVIAEVGGAVPDRTVVHGTEQGLGRTDSGAGQVQRDQIEMPGPFDALQSFETGP